MKKVYATPFAPTAHIASELLEDNGIEAVIQDESLPILAGAVPWQDTWPSVWVKDADEAAAFELLKDFGKETTSKEEGEDRTCPVCGEKINAQFGSCWKCAAAEPAEPSEMESLPSNEPADLRRARQTYRDGWYFIILSHVFLIAGFVASLILGNSASAETVKTGDAFWGMSLASWMVMLSFGLWKMVQAYQQGLQPRLARAAREQLKDIDHEATGKKAEVWICPTCGEKSEGRFGSCWKCAAAGQPEAPAQDISAFNQARRGLAAALLITLCAGYSLIFAGSSRRAFRLIGHFTPNQIVGTLVFTIGAVLSLYFIGQVFENSRSATPEKNVPHSRWLSDAAIRSRRGLMFALLASCSVPLLLSFFVRWLPSSWQRTFSLLSYIVPQLICYYFVVINIIRLTKPAPTETEKPTQEDQAK